MFSCSCYGGDLRPAANPWQVPAFWDCKCWAHRTVAVANRLAGNTYTGEDSSCLTATCVDQLRRARPPGETTISFLAPAPVVATARAWLPVDRAMFEVWIMPSGSFLPACWQGFEPLSLALYPVSELGRLLDPTRYEATEFLLSVHHGRK